MDACTYKMNILADLGCWIMHEVLILSESNKLTYRCHHILKRPMWLRWLVHPRGYTPLVIHYDKFAAWSAPPFIVTITTLSEYRRSLISRSDLFCHGKYIVTPTFKTCVQWVWEDLLWFFELVHGASHLFPGWIKNRVFKDQIHLFFQRFSLFS